MANPTEDEVLISAIGDLAGFWGRWGARFAAKRLPTEEAEEEFDVFLHEELLKTKAEDVLSRIGKISEAFNFGQDTRSGLVGSGQLNLNPTIVHVSVVEAHEARTRVRIRALAKEGLIKQDSARKAIARVRELLVAPVAEATYDILDGGKGIVRVLARVQMLPSQESGRTHPVRGSYRPNHNFGGPTNRSFYVGQLGFSEGESLSPGEAREIPVEFIDARGLRDLLKVGTKWRIQEGTSLVANAEVVRILDDA